MRNFFDMDSKILKNHFSIENLNLDLESLWIISSTKTYENISDSIIGAGYDILWLYTKDISEIKKEGYTYKVLQKKGAFFEEAGFKKSKIMLLDEIFIELFVFNTNSSNLHLINRALFSYHNAFKSSIFLIIKSQKNNDQLQNYLLDIFKKSLDQKRAITQDQCLDPCKHFNHTEIDIFKTISNLITTKHRTIRHLVESKIFDGSVFLMLRAFDNREATGIA